MIKPLCVAVVFLLGGTLSGCTSTNDQLASTCKKIVADWSGDDAATLTSQVLPGNYSAAAGVDLEGKYSGGMWRCSASTGDTQPNSVMVYPGGYDGGPDGTGIPESILH